MSSPTLKNLAGYMSLTYSITGLLIVLGLAGEYHLSSDVAIVQGAVLATFYVLSGDARHLILTDQNSAYQVIFFRLIWLFPLAIISYFMSNLIGQINESILCGLILRRSTEWLAEVHVTELERLNGVWRGWLLQPILFLLLAGQIIFTNELWFVWIWAISPIIFSSKFILLAKPHKLWSISWENITSTAIIGFTGYIQRVLIVSIAGKEFSGMLFPGFAIGSFVGSMAANVAGPTLFRKGLLHSEKFTIGLVILLVSGGLIFFISDTVVYQTVGLSILGGAFMISAQQERLSHLNENHTLALDLLFQLSLVFSILTIYYLGDVQAMLGFYFVGSVLAYIIYKGNQLVLILNAKWKKSILFLVSLGLIFPIFFQLSGNIYNNELIAVIDSGGNLKTLPLPFSILACYAGVILFGVSYEKAKPVVLTISAMFLLLIASTMITNQGISKIVLLLQYMLPTVALLLGVSLAHLDRKLFATVTLYFLVLFVPTQLIMTWFQGRLALTHYMYLFSVYSHYQYVPLIMTALFAWSWVELRETHSKWLYFIAPWMAMYVAAGNSILALFWLIIFSCVFAYFARKRKLDILIPILVVSTILGYFYINSKLAAEINKRINGSWVCQSGIYEDGLNSPCKPGVFHNKLFDRNGRWLFGNTLNSVTNESSANDNQSSANIMERKLIYSTYINDMVTDPESIVIGHPYPPPRNLVSSAHNYYLDLAYNFGILACLPLLALIFYTSKKVYQQKKYNPNLIWLLCIVFYIVIIDNNLKVTLRQPYPGILTFCLWGILLGALNSQVKSNPINA